MMSDFPGFESPEANFTPTPNQFFDHVVGRYEPCVVTVVAVLIRATLGWTSRVNGGRRIEADLPLSEFVRRGLSQESARKGLRLAEEAGFIRKTAPAGPRDPARYALRWADTERQDKAIEMERRAFGEKRRVLNSRTPKSRVLKSRTLKNGTPIYNDSERNSDSERNKESKDLTLNVREGLNFVGGEGGLSRAFDQQAATIAAELQDLGSERRHRQLLEICDRYGLTDLVNMALQATRDRLATQGRRGVIERPGAYYQIVLVKMLEDRQVFVPKAGEDDADEVRRLARESMSL